MSAEILREEMFENVSLRVLEQNGDAWFTAEDIGNALGLAEPRKQVINIFNRNRDEFEGIVRVTNLVTRSKDGRNRFHRYTVFNPQGAYLLAILARTPKSKALRRWLSHFMAHGVHRLRERLAAMEERVRELEARHEADQRRIMSLMGKLGRARQVREREAAAKALPGPEIEIPEPEGHKRDPRIHDLVVLPWRQFKRLVDAGLEAGVERNFLFTVLHNALNLEAVDFRPYDWQKLFHCLRTIIRQEIEALIRH